jgi:glycine cleavage system aminomethyltransferase T
LQLANLPNRLVGVLCKDPEPLMFHGEVVWRDGQRVGVVRAASYGHTLGGAVGLAMVNKLPNVPFDNKFLETGKWEGELSLPLA